MGLAGRSMGTSFLRRLGLSAALMAALLISGCDAGSAESASSEEAQEPLKQFPVIEPVEQRSPYGNYLAGRYAERQRDFGRAAAALGRVLDDFPENVGLLRRTFYLSLQAGQMDTAVRLARALENSGSRVSTAQLLLAADSAKKGDYEGSLARLKAIKREDLARYAVPLALAWADAGAGDVPSAVTALEPLEQEAGFETLRKLHEALILDFAGQNGRAGNVYKAALGDDPATAPNRIISAYGSFLERTGRADEARALYEGYSGADMENLLFGDALERIAQDREPEPRIESAADGMAEGFFDIASILPRERAGEIVLIYCRLALYLRPDFQLAQLLAADVYEGFGRYREASEILRNVDQAGAYGWAARLRLATDLYDLGDVDGAISLLREMSEERPERSDVLVQLGNILRYQERFDESVAAYDEAVSRMGELSGDDWVILYSRGVSLASSGQWERAERDFLRALELEPDQPAVLNHLGYSWVEMGKNLEQARDMLERAVAQRQDDGYIVDSMGWALYKLREFDEAVTYLERAVTIRPHDAEINDHLGDAYWRVGRRDEAFIQWQRALGLEPNEELREKLEKKVREGLPPESGGGGG